MISPKYFIETLKSQNIDFFTGVPDSLLKDLCAYIMDHITSTNNIIAANEGSAVGLATGYHLATNKIPVVYMQNSGIGNAVNPLLSLTDRDVYNIPLLLLIGWRGEPNIKDEPQHFKQGIVTIPLLNTLGIKNTIMSFDTQEFNLQLNNALNYISKTNEPFAFIIKKGVFDEYKTSNTNASSLSLSRELAIKNIINNIEEKSVIVSTTGMISRELYENRELLGENHEKDFLTVGSMGHASQIALGIALQKKDKRIYCFDGDGAAIMHMGSLAIIGTMKPTNYIHIVLNNGAHDSVGGQPTIGLKINFPQIALSCGYKEAFSIDDELSLKYILQKIRNINGPIFLEIKIKKGARKDLGRPKTTPVQNKNSFMNYLNNIK